MRRGAVPSATGEQPHATECAATPPSPSTLRIQPSTQRNFPGIRQLHRAWPARFRDPAALSPPYAGGTRRSWAGRPPARSRWSCSRGCASTSWRCRPTRAAPYCAGCRAPARWRCCVTRAAPAVRTAPAARNAAAGARDADATGNAMLIGRNYSSSSRRVARRNSRESWNGWSGATSYRISRHAGPETGCPPPRSPVPRYVRPARRPADSARGRPRGGCDLPSQAARPVIPCPSRGSGQESGTLGAPPTSYDSWARRRRNATGPGCCVLVKPNRIARAAISRWPSRMPHECRRGHGHGH